jgi:prepilin-type N-terminal cleavage/methylation domain-containing protein
MNNINKKAFTLIELMAVVIILGIVSTITVVAINYTIQTSKQRLYIEQIERLTSSVRKWAVDNTEQLPTSEGGVVFFSVSRLKDEGIVDTEVVMDPRTSTELDGCVTIKYEPSFQEYDYKYEDMDCSLVEDAYLPVITVTGGDAQTAEVNSYYELPIATSVDYSGRSVTVEGPIIKKDGNIVTNLDLGLVNDVYELIYESIDPKLNLTATKTITLTVVDTVAPVITVSSSTINHEAGDPFTPPSVIVSDNSCGETGIDTSVNNCITTLTPSINSGGFSPIIPNTYPIYYTATDSSGNIRVAVVNVIVSDTQGPNISTLTYRLNTSAGAAYAGAWTKENVWVGNISAPDQGSGLREYRYYLTTTGDTCRTTYGSYTTLPNTTTEFTITNSHNGKLCFWAVDNVFNPSVIREQAILIEKTGPTIDFINTSTSSSYYNNASFIAITNPVSGQDVTSGLTQFRYEWTTSVTNPTNMNSTTCSGGTLVSFTNGTTSSVPSTTSIGRPTTSGTHYLHVCAEDRAGNIFKTSSIYYLDVTKPVLGASNASSTWYASRTTTVSATDAHSGILEIRYHWNANDMNESCTSGGTVAIHNEVLTVPPGSNQLFICARDNASNVETYDSGANMFRVDSTPPSAPTITVNESWTNAASVSASIGGSIDLESSILRYEYSLSGATTQGWTEGNSLNITVEGETTITARAVNGATMESATTQKVVRIDRTAPTPPLFTDSGTANIIFGDYDTTFESLTVDTNPGFSLQNNATAGVSTAVAYTSTKSFRVTSVNNSISRAYRTKAANAGDYVTFGAYVYSTTPGAYLRMELYGGSYTWNMAASVTHSGNGWEYMSVTYPEELVSNTTAYYFIYPGLNNTVYVDNIKLETDAWKTTNSTVVMRQGKDSLSGVVRNDYSTTSDTGPWTTYTGALSYSTTTNTTIYARTIDAAGNVSSVFSRRVRIDKTMPITPTVSLGSYTSGYWTKDAVTMTLSSTDSHSGLLRYQYSHDQLAWTNWETYSGHPTNPWTLDSAGNWPIFYARAVDNVGNVSLSSTSWGIRIDRTNPTISITTNANAKGWHNAAALAANTNPISAQDTDSGIATNGIRYAWSTSTTSPLAADCSSGGYAQTVTGGTTTAVASAATSGRPTTSGTWYLYACVRDQALNVASTSATYLLDVNPPTLTSITGGRATWAQTSVTLYWTATDTGGSGLSRGATAAPWSINDGMQFGYGTSVTPITFAASYANPSSITQPTTDGISTYNGSSVWGASRDNYVYFRVWDRAGNVSTVQPSTGSTSNRVRIDATNPIMPAVVCGYKYNSSLGVNEHYITIGDDDHSGVASTTFSVLQSSGGSLLGGPYTTTTKWTSGTYIGRTRRMVPFTAAQNPIHLSSITITDNVGRTFSPSNTSPSCGLCTTYPERCW